jgi:hypothetical protein
MGKKMVWPTRGFIEVPPCLRKLREFRTAIALQTGRWRDLAKRLAPAWEGEKNVSTRKAGLSVCRNFNSPIPGEPHERPQIDGQAAARVEPFSLAIKATAAQILY